MGSWWCVVPPFWFAEDCHCILSRWGEKEEGEHKSFVFLTRSLTLFIRASPSGLNTSQWPHFLIPSHMDFNIIIWEVHKHLVLNIDWSQKSLLPCAQQKEMANSLRCLHSLNDEQLCHTFPHRGGISAANIISPWMASLPLSFTNKETLIPCNVYKSLCARWNWVISYSKCCHTIKLNYYTFLF